MFESANLDRENLSREIGHAANLEHGAAAAPPLLEPVSRLAAFGANWASPME